MNKFFLAFLSTLFLFASASAEQLVINVDGKLTDEQKAQLQLQAAQQAGTGNVSKATVVKEWVDVGSAVGVGLANTAKELGIAANEIANSPVGKITVFLIAWNYMGEDVIQMAFGLVWIFFAVPLWVWVYRTNRVNKTETYYETGKGPNGERKVIKRTVNELGDATHFFYWLTLMGVILVGFLAIVV